MKLKLQLPPCLDTLLFLQVPYLYFHCRYKPVFSEQDNVFYLVCLVFVTSWNLLACWDAWGGRVRIKRDDIYSQARGLSSSINKVKPYLHVNTKYAGLGASWSSITMLSS